MVSKSTGLAEGLKIGFWMEPRGGRELDRASPKGEVAGRHGHCIRMDRPSTNP